jgi:RNA polymerase sigma-70 factor (sigma-E family)
VDRSLEEDFGDFIDSASPRLLGLAWYLSGDEHEAQDLVQETLERVYVRWPKLSRDAEGSAAVYARRVLVNLRTDRWRRRRREVVVDAQELAEAAPSRSEAGPATVDLVSALRLLAPRERQVVVLRYYADQSERTVADLLGVTTGTVKTAAHRGLAKLREALAEGEHSHAQP